MPSVSFAYSTSTIRSLIVAASTKYDVDPSLALYVAEHESSFDPTEVGDLTINCKDGSPVYARGLYQITRCYWPDITDARAFDPIFSIDWAMNILSNEKKCKQTFTTCRWFYEGIPKEK